MSLLYLPPSLFRWGHQRVNRPPTAAPIERFDDRVDLGTSKRSGKATLKVSPDQSAFQLIRPPCSSMT
jgi:hypothetical protein